jgi:hypothetical protein
VLQGQLSKTQLPGAILPKKTSLPRSQTNVDIRNPELVDRRGRDLRGEVRVYRQVMARVRCHDERAPAHTEQVVLAHHPQHSFVVDRAAASAP